MIVAKFGGTSVSSKESILTLCKIIGNELNRQPIVVVSALSGVTDLILSLPTLSKSKLLAELKRLRQIHKNLIKSVFKDKNTQKKIGEFIDEKIAEILKINLTTDKKILDKLA